MVFAPIGIRNCTLAEAWILLVYVYESPRGALFLSAVDTLETTRSGMVGRRLDLPPEIPDADPVSDD